MKRLILLLLTGLLLNSCFKEDDAVPPRQLVGSVDTIGMGQYYKYQLYFDLGTGEVVKSNAKTDWDLGFECRAQGFHIILNTSNFMKAADAGIRPFGQPQDTTGMKWVFDKSDGNLDSTVFSQWYQIFDGDTVSNQHVYLLDRGMDEMGNVLGFRQIIIDSLKNGTYYFRLAYLDGGSTASYRLTKDPSVNFLLFTFRFGGVVQHLEPPRQDWDLFFTQYTTLLYTDLGEPYPYLVTGVLLNRYQVAAIQDTLHTYENLTHAEAESLSLSTRMDLIGYDWKYYDFDNSLYTIRPGRVYVIRDTDGDLYKMRFVGFYNAQGEKGYPVIEHQKL